MKLIIAENEYELQRAEQVVNVENIQFFIYLSEDISVEEFYEEIKDVFPVKFNIDDEEFSGYNIDSIRKAFDYDGVPIISVYASKVLQ